ncbi:UNVERIFIED_CONTAM: hypothetical protein Scaly_2916700 [Sesamum calycinum]|uniref:Uncharacterized protein n=1 Tax=Sesamum calycinum TaxID=2727403 RepID=A0AAW2L198_9LAMI
MDDGSSVYLHCIQILSFTEKLEDLTVVIENDIYIDVFLQSLTPVYDPFLVNFNMIRLEKFSRKLINILVQFKIMIKISKPVIMLGEDSTSKNGKSTQDWKKKKRKAIGPTPTTKLVVKVSMLPKGKRWWFLKPARSSSGAHIYNDLRVMVRNRRLSIGKVDLWLENGKTIASEAVELVH